MIAWHYTTGECFERIAAAGFLRPATTGIDPGERPIVWFSINQHWEITANKGWLDKFGTRTSLTMEGTREKGRGLVRFGIDDRRLVPWPKIARKARMSTETKASLERTAKERGSIPSQWRGTFKTIHITDLIIEVMNELGEWERVKQPATKGAQ
jgi:hypothetical protein